MLHDWNSAEMEMLNVPDQFAAFRTVLKIQTRIYLRTNRSHQALALAETLVKKHPHEPEGWNHRSLALQHLGRVGEAYAQLLPVLRRFPDHYMIPYNLACFLCQLGRLAEAIPMLARTFAINDSFDRRLRALAEPDLQLLWIWRGIRTASDLPKLWNPIPCIKNQTRISCATNARRNSLN